MIHSRISTLGGTGGGTTVGSFDAVNTRNTDNKLPEGTTQVVGFTAAGARIAETAAKSTMWRLRVNSPNLGMNNEDFLLGHVDGAGIATNDQGTINQAEFLPAQIFAEDLRKTDFGLSTINFFVSLAGLTTDAVSLVASPVSFNAKTGPAPITEWYNGRLNWPGLAVASMGSLSPNGAASGTTANSDTSLGTVTVRSEYKVISAIRLIQGEQAVGTAGEEAVAWGRFDGSATTITGLAPNEWPINAIGPTLGTPVGGPVYDHVSPLPTWITKGVSGDVTVDSLVNVITAITAANQFAVGLFLRR